MDVNFRTWVQPPESAPPRTPEENLWWAVLYTLVRDIEHRAKDMHREIDRKGCVSIYNDEEWRSLLRAVDTPWMFEVCEFVGWHHRRLKQVVEGLVKKYDLESYPVQNKDENFIFLGITSLRKRGT